MLTTTIGAYPKPDYVPIRDWFGMAGGADTAEPTAGYAETFAAHAATRTFSYPLAGPDGLALRPGLLAVAEYGEGRVHLFDRDGRHLRTLKVEMPFVDTVAWDEAGNLYAGGSFQNARPPYEGAVMHFAPADWQPNQ